MQKKIYAIGGGKDFGIYREMIKFSEIKNPNVLIIPHAQPLNKQQGNYNRMYNLLSNVCKCKLKILKSNDLANEKRVQEMLKSSDILYVCEGDTLEMLTLWKNYHFDERLKEQYEQGKMLSGTSAGALCWFHSFTSEREGLLRVGNGLNFMNGYLTCHGQNRHLAEFHKEQLKNK